MKKDIKTIFSENLKYYMNQRNENLTKLSDSLDIAYSTVSDWLHGKKMPRSGSLQKLADHYNINTSDLTSDVSKTSVDNILNISDFSKYNYYDTGLSAGMLTEVDPFTRNDVQTVALSDVIMGKYAGDKDVFISRLNGESMNRVIPSGSMIAVKKYKSLQELCDGDIVVFQDGGDMSVKRYYNSPKNRTITFNPDSSDTRFYPITYRYEDLDDIRILGKVVVYTVNLN